MSQDNSDQAAFWTTSAGQKWVEQQEILDAFMQPVLDGLFERAPLRPGDRVLDIGCGTGASTLQAADRVGADGFVLGADISPTMLAHASARAEGASNVAFEVADAAAYRFDTRSFDHLISRFGVMFFAEPVAAFRNILTGLKPGAEVTFAAWGQIQQNPWFTIAAQAAKEALGAPPSVDPDAPGPFAFRDVARVTDILTKAGFTDVSADVAEIHLSPPGLLPEVARMATSVGPAARTVDYFQGSAADADAIAVRVEKAFEAFQTDQGVRVPAEINFFKARRADR
ncbi:class I SAM-dependent methyltransferase [Roseobacter sp.]|uniref:class I SAM-dependent methyltransferase n=1 Tax=Roseobacter sp. TaxID=1907202 RepID=UPI0029667BAE|nr:class I SAM-dependent methyltransferase [Roseobacter sp.]MDW3184172.1 class I SAM-dependent methyltransferase [Roseobacter sp.]